jgi:hypothetical protein
MKTIKYLTAFAATVLSVLLVVSYVQSGATFSRVKTFASGETIKAAEINAEFDNILNNLDPDGLDDASANAAAMRVTADPYPASAESLATSLRGELQRIRYQIKGMTNGTYWYSKETVDILQDADGDTYVEVENATDEDKVRVKIQGVEMFKVETGEVTVFGTEANNAYLGIYADNGDDNADKMRFDMAATGTFSMDYYATGAWATAYQYVPGSTAHTFVGASSAFNMNTVTLKADASDELTINLQRNNATSNSDKWKVESGTTSIALQSYSSGGWVVTHQFNDGGAFFINEINEVGADPLCWDGTAGSFIGDCTSSLEVKENVKDYSLPSSQDKVREITENEKDRIDTIFPEKKTYSSNIEMLKDITVKTFNLNITPEQKEEDEIGIIAEQVYKINPLLVNIRKNKVTGIAWFNVISWLVKVNQEQQAQIEALDARIKKLEAK